MDLQRQDYPGMLDKLQPVQAVNLLNERLRYINRLNVDVAEWLLERRRIEEAYATSLRKLAGRGFRDSDLSDLGIFQIPWQKVVAATETLATAHYGLAQSIGTDVEIPLREWTTKDRDMQQMTNIIGNIQAIARELENAQKKSEKLSGKGGKADAGKVATAATDVENALTQWESQAPYVFERLQAVDEARVDNMRNLLTQYQTTVIEAGSALSASAEDSLNALLNVQTADEIKTFAMKTTKTLPRSQRRQSMRQELPPPSTDAGSSLAPVPSLPRDDGSSHRSNSFQDRPERPPIVTEKSSEKGSKFGLKRIGTVIGRRRQSTQPYTTSRSPERKKSSSDVRSPFSRFTRKESSHQPLEPVPSPPQTAYSNFEESTANRISEAPPELNPNTTVSSHGVNGTTLDTVHERDSTVEPVNGTGTTSTALLQEPLQPTPVTYEPPKDEHGFTIPPPSHQDPMQQALAEAAEANETQPQFKVDIKNAPIQEESGDTSAAFAKFGDALQSQTNPRRSMGTIRNRRDRNTIMIPNGQSIPELPKDASIATPPGSAPLPTEMTTVSPAPVIEPLVPPSVIAPIEAASATQTTAPTAAFTATTPSIDTSATPPPPQIGSPASQSSPFKMTHRSTLGLDDHANSDTHSIRSGRSLGSTVSTTVRHPEMHEPGLNSSFVETLSASFSDGKVARASLVGEIGLSFNPLDLDAPFGTDTIKLENLGTNDKLAPNPAFIDALPDKPGQFSVKLAQITKTQVAFKYQVHITPEQAASHVPLLLQSQWRVDGKEAYCRVHYALNPSTSFDSLTFSDLAIVIHVDTSLGARLQSCRASDGFKFRKESGLVYWKLGDVTLTKAGSVKPLLARFVTDGEVKPGTVEARWEVNGSLGSGVVISRRDEPKGKGKEVEEDPFADEDDDGSHKEKESWRDVMAVKKWRTGSYVAS